MYFEEDTLVIFITHLYYLRPHHVVVPWGHASEICCNLIASAMFYFMLLIIFCGASPYWASLVMHPPSFSELICV